MVVVFTNPVLTDMVVSSTPINVPVYGYNADYTFDPGANKMDRSMLYGLDGSITPKQASTWTLREQAPMAGTNGWGFAFDGSNDAIVHDFTTANPTLPAGTYGITFPYEMLATYKTQKSISATVISTGTQMSTDSSGNPISTDGYSGVSKVITITIPQDKTGYSTLACYPDDPVVEWDGTFANGLSGLNGQDTTGGGPDGTLPYAMSKLSTTTTVDMMSQYVYMAGRTDRAQIEPATNYTISFYAKGTGKLDVYFINNFLDNTAANTATPAGVTFNVSPSPNQNNSFAEINLTSTYTLYTLNIKTTSSFVINQHKQLMFRLLANSQAYITPVSMVKSGSTTNIIRASTYTPSSYDNASFEYKGWQIKARTDWNGIPIQGVSTMISNPVNIKSPGSTTKTFVNGLENFDLYNIVASNQMMFIKQDNSSGQMSYATNATSNISMVYGLPASDESNGTSSLYTQHGATDSRGYSSTTLVGNQTTVYPYTKPTLSGLTIARTANMAELVPTFTINGTKTINGLTTDTTVVANITINGTAYVIVGVTSNASLKSKSWYTRNSSGVLVSATPVNVDPFSSYTVTFEVHDTVYAGGPKSTVATSTQVNTAGGTPVSYTPSWSAVPVGTTSASLKTTATASSNVIYNQPSLSPQGSNYATYYTGEFDTPPVTYPTDDPRYHRNLRFDFTLSGTVIVGPGSTINNLTRVDFTCDGVTYSDILGGNGQNAVGPYTFTTNKLNNGNGLSLDPGIVHTGSLILYDTKNGLSAGSTPASTINWSSTPDSILLDIDGDINNGGGLGVGGYHTDYAGALNVVGDMYLETQTGDVTKRNKVIHQSNDRIEMINPDDTIASGVIIDGNDQSISYNVYDGSNGYYQNDKGIYVLDDKGIKTQSKTVFTPKAGHTTYIRTYGQTANPNLLTGSYFENGILPSDIGFGGGTQNRQTVPITDLPSAEYGIRFYGNDIARQTGIRWPVMGNFATGTVIISSFYIRNDGTNPLDILSDNHGIFYTSNQTNPVVTNRLIPNDGLWYRVVGAFKTTATASQYVFYTYTSNYKISSNVASQGHDFTIALPKVEIGTESALAETPWAPAAGETAPAGYIPGFSQRWSTILPNGRTYGNDDCPWSYLRFEADSNASSTFPTSVTANQAKYAIQNGVLYVYVHLTTAIATSIDRVYLTQQLPFVALKAYQQSVFNRDVTTGMQGAVPIYNTLNTGFLQLSIGNSAAPFGAPLVQFMPDKASGRTYQGTVQFPLW